MTDENSLDNTDTTASTVEEDVVDENTPDVEVEKPDNSEKEVGDTTDELETLRAEVKALSGKLSTIRKTADKNAGARTENMRLKAALKAGLSEDSLSLLTADNEEAIAIQVEAIRKISAPNYQQHLTLAGDNGGAAAQPSRLEQKISEQLKNLNL